LSRKSRALLLAARRIAVVRDDALGDLVLALPMFAVLRERCPGAELHLLCRRYASALTDGLPVLDRVHFVDEVAGGVGAVLAAGGFDAVFLPRIRGVDCWSAWRARIPLRVGSAYRWYSPLLSHRVKDRRKVSRYHEAEYNTRMIGSVLGETVPTALVRPRVDPGARESVQLRLSAAGVTGDARIVVLHPGSGGNSREWPAEHFGALGAVLGAEPGLRIIVTGVESERARSEALVAAVGGRVRVVTLVGELGLPEVIALLDRSALLVANSTGVLHIAAALGTPVLGLYPREPAWMSAARNGPYTTRARVLTPPATAPQEMDRIAPEDAVGPARELLGSARI
jgi:ADP-heptose:LPS heptosyltransferase